MFQEENKAFRRVWRLSATSQMGTSFQDQLLHISKIMEGSGKFPKGMGKGKRYFSSHLMEKTEWGVVVVVGGGELQVSF